MFHFERGLCPRNRFLGEVSEGAVEAPSEETPQMGPYHRSSYSKSVSALPATGTKSGWPYFSTPKALITACVSGDSRKSAKALPPATLTRGPLAGFTSSTE